MVFQRPNKLRIKSHLGELVCDGKKWYGCSKENPDQAVLRDAPAKIEMPMVTADIELDHALNGGFAGNPPQLVLLLQDRPFKVLLNNVRSKDISLGAPVRLGDFPCYRVIYRRSEGMGEYWIDQETFVLRHAEFRAYAPVSREGRAPAAGAIMQANFQWPRLGGEVNPRYFAVAVPKGTECHRALMNPGPYRVIGKKIDAFRLVDLKGNPWTSDSLRGKIAVLHFWQTDVPACPGVVPSLQRAYEKFKDDPRVAFWAINLDGGQVDNKTIEETARNWKLTLPVLRDLKFDAPQALKIDIPPDTFFLDAARRPAGLHHRRPALCRGHNGARSKSCSRARNSRSGP